MMTIDEMQEVLSDLADAVPEFFFQELNGGIILLPQAVQSPEARRGDLYTMGEYITDPVMGRYIALYYGSFQQLFRDEPEAVLREELRETLLHELTHHVESLAGEYGLEVKDEEELRAYLCDSDRDEECGYVRSPKLKSWKAGRAGEHPA